MPTGNPKPQHIRDAAVRDYVDGGLSCSVVGARYGISSTVVSKWAIADRGYKAKRALRYDEGAPMEYDGGWVMRAGVMRPLEPVRRAG